MIKTISDLKLERVEHQETLAMRAAVDIIKHHHLEAEFGSRLRLIAIQENEPELAESLGGDNK